MTKGGNSSLCINNNRSVEEARKGILIIEDDPATPQVNETAIMAENRSEAETPTPKCRRGHYYPFGMNQEGPWYTEQGPANQYLYNGKELNEDLGLNWIDYGARWYDASLGRWWSVDPMAAETPAWAVFHYTYNNPIKHIDLFGLIGGNPNDYYDEAREKVQNKYNAALVNNNIEETSNQYNFPKLYYANAAKLNTKGLTDIFNFASGIFEKNEILGVSYIPVDVDEAKKHKLTYEYQMFLAIVDRKVSENEVANPGNSYVSNGRVGVYDEEIKTSRYPFNGFLSYVNISHPDIANHSNPSYAAGYIVAHETLHQLVKISSFYQFSNKNPYPDHVDIGRPHLNAHGHQVRIPSGPSNVLRPEEEIISYHKKILNFYIKK